MKKVVFFRVFSEVYGIFAPKIKNHYCTFLPAFGGEKCRFICI